jgi:hypothetical protein
MNRLRDALTLLGEHIARHSMLCLFAALLCACQQPASGADGQAKDGKYMLTIYGYNYTNHYIDQFSVNGAGGGNLDVSTPDAGGGKSACCMVWRDGTPLPRTVHIEWAFNACEYTSAPNIYGERFDTVHNYVKEQAVQLKGPVPKNPGYFEVHFYPDGHIEVAISATSSEPRLKLPADREPAMRRCTDDEVKRFKQ